MEAVVARAIQVLIALGGAYALALWFALIAWTFQDIQLRSRSVIAQIFSTLVVVLFFLPGVLIYMILRPRETLDESFQRSLEEEYLLQDLEELPLCPNCQHYVDAEFIFCPNCRTQLRQDCLNCGRMLDLRWDICPYCGEEQYEQDHVPYLPQEWERTAIEGAGVGRFLGQARERLGGRKRDALSDGSPAEETRELQADLDDEQDPVIWDTVDDDDDPWLAGQPSDAVSANGHGAFESDMGRPFDGDEPDPFDQTDELPVETRRTFRPPR